MPTLTSLREFLGQWGENQQNTCRFPVQGDRAQSMGGLRQLEFEGLSTKQKRATEGKLQKSVKDTP